LAAMLVGFGLTVAISLTPALASPGDSLERLLPFAIALAIALAGVRRSVSYG